MDEKKKEAFRLDCTKFLLSVSICEVRNYARKLGVTMLAKKTKESIIKECIEILLRENKDEWSGLVGFDYTVVEVTKIWNKHFGEDKTEETPIKRQREDTEDILSTLTEEQKREVNGFLKFLKEWK